MSRTYRKAPQNHVGLRKPHTQQERRQLSCLKNDEPFLEFDISPRNRLHRHVVSDWDDIIASSIYELDYAVQSMG